jgi:hypothetical protein
MIRSFLRSVIIEKEPPRGGDSPWLERTGGARARN